MSKLPLKRTELYHAVTSQMNDVYGEQAHIPADIVLKLADIYPELFQAYFTSDAPKGHLIILPLNERGKEKITDLENDEGDFEFSDFELNPGQETPVYFFVYSIYGKSQRYSFQMIKQMCEGIKIWSSKVSPESYIFAECVSPEGIRLSEKLGMRLYHTYTFREEELFLYKASLTHFVSTSLALSSLAKPGNGKEN